MLVVGVTGRNCAGKDEVAAILESKGFERHSLSDALRAELDARGLPRTRENLIAIGNRLRAEEGPGVLAERMKRMMEGDRVVLVSIRNPAEIAALRELSGFFLVGVDAPLEMRFEREVRRGRENVPASLEEFTRREALENSSDANAQQLDACLALADETIINDGTLQELRLKVDQLYERVEHGR